MEERSRQQFYRVKDLANRWRVSQMHVHRLIRRGFLQATKIGRSVRVASRDVLRFEQRAQTSRRVVGSDEGVASKGGQ
jgi:excisionase family DNA binding protein